MIQSLIKYIAACFTMFFVLTGSMVYAETTLSADTKPVSADGRGWEFLLTSYMWLTGIDSTVKVHGHKVDSKISFSDMLKNLDFAGQVHIAARKGRWGFFIDPTYTKMAVDGSLRDSMHTRLQVQQWLVEFGGIYQLGKWPLEGGKGRHVTIDALGGGRYWYMNADFHGSNFINISKSNQWVDPFIGARLTVDITEKLLFGIRGDIGGFGVGSDFSWNALGLIGYRFTNDVTGLLGYRALYVDYKAGTSSSRYNMTIHGPIMGLAFSF